MFPPATPVLKVSEISFDPNRSPDLLIKNFLSERKVLKNCGPDEAGEVNYLCDAKAQDACETTPDSVFCILDAIIKSKLPPVVYAADILNYSDIVAEDLIGYKIPQMLNRFEVWSLESETRLNFKVPGYGLWDSLGRIKFVESILGPPWDTVSVKRRLSCRVLLPRTKTKNLRRVCNLSIPTGLVADAIYLRCNKPFCYSDRGRIRFPSLYLSVEEDRILIGHEDMLKNKSLGGSKGDLLYEIKLYGDSQWRRFPLAITPEEARKAFIGNLALRIRSQNKMLILSNHFKDRSEFDGADDRTEKIPIQDAKHYFHDSKEIYSDLVGLRNYLILSLDFVSGKNRNNLLLSKDPEFKQAIGNYIKDQFMASGGNNVCPNIFRSSKISDLAKAFGVVPDLYDEPSRREKERSSKKHQGLSDFMRVDTNKMCKARQLVLEIMASYLL